MNLYSSANPDAWNRPPPPPLHLSLSFVFTHRKWVERLQELINANPKTHPTDCVSRATKQQLDRFVSVRARFENLMDGQKEREREREGKEDTRDKRTEILGLGTLRDKQYSKGETQRERERERKKNCSSSEFCSYYNRARSEIV